MKRHLQSKVLLICSLMAVLISMSENLYSQGSGYALEFDGIDDYVSVASAFGDELNPQNAVTIESWIFLSEPASATHRPHYLGKSLSYQLIIEATGLPVFYVWDNGSWVTTSGTTSLEAGKWYHIAATYDSLDIRIYVNGKMEGTPSAKSPPLDQNDNDVRFGDRLGGEEALSGFLDEIRIWDVAKTETELQNGMNMKLVGDEPNLVGYWRLDEESGTVTPDLTTYSNDGTLTNMEPSTGWITSTAPIGDTSILSESDDINETSTCEIDVSFGIGLDAPGSGYSMAGIQVNEPPNDITGLLHTVAGLYWEIWSEESNFDGDFTATIQFHYDNINGINDESDLILYRRDSATAGNWISVSGYTIVTNDGASSTINDGIGYIQLDISELTMGGFSGQYILGWNLPPVANVDAGNTDEDASVIIDILDNDADTDGTITPSTVTISADPSQGTISNINTTTGEITYTPNSNYFGSDQFSYTVGDNGGATSNIALVDVTINSVNDTLIVTDIPDQTIEEGEIFATISLDDFVSDIEDPDIDIIWTWSGNTDLTVTIDGSRVATIGIPDENWNGEEIITFTATDQDGGQDSDSVTFLVTPVNDLPVVSNIPDQTIMEGGTFTAINLDDYVTDIDNLDAEIEWSWVGNTDLTIVVDSNRVATVGVPDENWSGVENIIFTATDLEDGQDSDTVSFSVTSENDLPVVDDIPDQTVNEGELFATISMDDYVSDIDGQDADILWTWSGNSELTVSIDNDRIVTIGIPDENWNGSETITFTADDQNGGSDSDMATFTVVTVNDAPVLVSQIPDTTGATLEEFVFQFDSLAFEDVDAGDTLTYEAALTTGDLPAWLSFDDVTLTFSGTPESEDAGVYIVVLTAFDQDMESASDTFEINIIRGILGLKDLAEEWNLKVYPNPTDGIFIVNMNLKENEDIRLKIFTPSGQLIKNENYTNQIGNLRLTLNLTGYKKGLHILRIITKSGVATKQVMIY